jgi:hypothetical protein
MVAGEDAIWEARSGGKIEGVQVPSYLGNMGIRLKRKYQKL